MVGADGNAPPSVMYKITALLLSYAPVCMVGLLGFKPRTPFVSGKYSIAELQPISMAPSPRVELGTPASSGRRSTVELERNMVRATRLELVTSRFQAEHATNCAIL